MDEDKSIKERDSKPADEIGDKEITSSEVSPEGLRSRLMRKRPAQSPEHTAKPVLFAVVAKILDPTHVIINKGSVDGIQLGQRFLLYRLSGEEIFDPITNEPLGELEIRKGTGRVVELQDRISTLQSDDFEPIKPATIGAAAELLIMGGAALKWRSIPFSDPAVGDLAKPVS